jgi:membrane fusion protein (multidrug efflux system)
MTAIRTPASTAIRTMLLLGALLAVIGCGSDHAAVPGTGGDSHALTVEAVIVAPQLLYDRITTTGTLIANEEVQLRPEVSGRITGVHFDEGRRVRKGDLLLQINDSELKAQSSRKEYETRLAANDESRKRSLLDINAISREEYDKSLNTLRMLQAEMDVIRSQLAQREIRAPFDGVIGLRYVSEGGFVNSNMLAATMQDLDPMKVEFTVPEKYARRLNDGTNVMVRVGDSEEEYRGVIYAVESKIDPATRTIKSRATIPNPESRLIPGSFAKIEITLAELYDALVIPAEAIIPELSGQKVFVCTGGQSKPVSVTTGIRTERGVQITEGLAPGDTLITTGLLQLSDGRAVQIASFAGQ